LFRMVDMLTPTSSRALAPTLSDSFLPVRPDLHRLAFPSRNAFERGTL